MNVICGGVDLYLGLNGKILQEYLVRQAAFTSPSICPKGMVKQKVPFKCSFANVLTVRRNINSHLQMCLLISGHLNGKRHETLDMFGQPIYVSKLRHSFDKSTLGFEADFFKFIKILGIYDFQRPKHA